MPAERSIEIPAGFHDGGRPQQFQVSPEIFLDRVPECDDRGERGHTERHSHHSASISSSVPQGLSQGKSQEIGGKARSMLEHSKDVTQMFHASLYVSPIGARA